MPVTMEWYNEEKTISHMKFTKPWTWDEFYIAYKKGSEMTESVNHKVNIIMDFLESGGMLPPSALTHFRKAAANAHPRRGVVVLVSKRMGLLKMMVKIITSVSKVPSSLLLADSLEEAQNIINHIIEDKPDTIHLR